MLAPVQAYAHGSSSTMGLGEGCLFGAVALPGPGRSCSLCYDAQGRSNAGVGSNYPASTL